MPSKPKLLKSVGALFNDLGQLKNAYPNANKFFGALANNIKAVAPPNPMDTQASQEYAMNRAFDAPMLGAVKVYHGSPHKFDAFDMSKIGTGEGAQAYGHGLYFAEDPKTAEWYKEKLGSYDAQKDVDFLNKWYDIIPEGDVKKAIGRNDSIDDILSTTDSEIEWLSKNYPDDNDLSVLSKFADEYRSLDVDKSYLYETSLQWPDAAREAADPLGPQHFIDWDKPLSEQPESVKKALKKSDYEYGKLIGGGKIFNTESPVKAGNAYEDLKMKLRPPGHITTVFGSGSGNSKAVYQDIVTQHLRDLGIPGIRYLDQGSRGAGSGTYNYVVFDDNIPKIISVNGEPIFLK